MRRKTKQTGSSTKAKAPDKTVIRSATKAERKVSLPCSEADLLVGLDPYGAHADELAQPSAAEFGA